MSSLTRILSHVLPVLALTVIVFGAYVRLSDAGLGCPDWPGCYGRLTVPAQEPSTAQHPSWRDRPLVQGKAWREMIHRYLASTLGLGILVLAIGSFRPGTPRAARAVALILVPLVILQGLLGMWTVTLLLKPIIVCAHLLGGMTILALLWWNLLEVRGGGLREAHGVPGLRSMVWLALACVGIQIFLGGWTSANYAALACQDFPTCQGHWWPQTDFHQAFVLWRGLGINYEYGILNAPARTAIHMTHRIWALVTTVVVAATVMRAVAARSSRVRVAAWCILAALICQVTLGISNVLGGLPLAVAVAHNGGAAILLLSIVTLLNFTRAV